MSEKQEQTQHNASKPPPFIAALAITGLIALVLSAAVVYIGTRPTAPDLGLRIPDFQLIDQNDQSVDASALDDGPTVLAFIFTNCPTACPGMAKAMKYVQDETAGSGAKLLSISVDPENDTPEVLRVYAESIGADPERWRFVTGDVEEVLGVLRGLGLDIADIPNSEFTAPSGKKMMNIAHPTRLILVDSNRSVRDFYPYLEEAALDQLIDLINRRAVR